MLRLYHGSDSFTKNLAHFFAVEARASIIASHFYKGNRLAKPMSTASAPSVGGVQSRFGCSICPQYVMYPQEP
jgi:hypothetical protein